MVWMTPPNRRSASVTRFLGRHALAHVLVRRLGYVRVDLDTQFTVVPCAAANESEKPRQQDSQCGHDCSS